MLSVPRSSSAPHRFQLVTMGVDSTGKAGPYNPSRMGTDWRALAEAVRAVPAEVGFWARRLDTGEEWAADADRIFPAASTIKVPILVQLFRRVEAGELRLDERVELIDERKAVGS